MKYIFLRKQGLKANLFVFLCGAASGYLQGEQKSRQPGQVCRTIQGVVYYGQKAMCETTQSIMLRQKAYAAQMIKKVVRNRPRVRRSEHSLTHNPLSPKIAQFCVLANQAPQSDRTRISLEPRKALAFTAARFGTDSFDFPPDSMGGIGPDRFVMTINGLFKSFNKTTGKADGVLDVDPDVFFSSVANNSGTSDPRIRYDRFSKRWFIVMINVETSNNRIMIAVSDSGTITSNTAWHFYFIPAGDNTFLDYPTLGIDAHALYIGGVTFPGDATTESSDTGEVFVVNKNSLLTGGPIMFTGFHNLIDPNTGVGPFAPQGVDNFDAGATNGYFVAVDNASFGLLDILQISNPAGSPAIAHEFALTVPDTAYPLPVPHKGNNNPRYGTLDALDDRLFDAHIRNGVLWTVHNVGVDNTGVSSSSAITRDGARWYAINLSQATPQLAQSGTVFTKSASNDAQERFYWVPSIMTTGDGRVILGCSSAGIKEFANAAITQRFTSDPIGTMEPPVLFTNSLWAYNPPDDPGDANNPRRWGDYSYTSLDPADNMTVWTVQEFCCATNTWGVTVAKIIAPPPAKPIQVQPSHVRVGLATATLKITGQSVSGSGYYDPGAGFSGRLRVLISNGVIIKSVQVTSKTTLTVTVSTARATLGAATVTIINPDGQRVQASNLFSVIA